MDALCSNFDTYESFCSSVPRSYPSSCFSSTFQEVNYSDDDSESQKRTYTTIESSTPEKSSIAEEPVTKRLKPDVEDTPPVSSAPLYDAICAKNFKLVQLYLAYNPNINVSNDRTSPLHFSVRYNDIPITKELLRYGFSVNKEDSERQTPLHIAVELGLREMVRLLLNNGADANVHNKHGVAPIHTAVRNSNSRPVRANMMGDDGKFITEDLARLANERKFDTYYEVVEELLECRSVDHNIPCTLGKTALYYSVVGVNATYAQRLVELLLRYGADVNVMNICGRTALSRAMTLSHYGIIELLLKKGANIDVPINDARVTPILWGVSRCRGDIIDLLLKYNAFDVNDPNLCPSHASLLHYAAEYSSSCSIRGLINAGADVRIVSAEGATPFLHCPGNASSRYVANRKLFLEHMVKLESQKYYKLKDEELKYIYSDGHFELELHYMKLKMEMLTLKASKIPKTKHTFYDLLMSSDHSASFLIQDLSVQKYCTNRVLKKLFPAFSRIMYDRYTAGQVRADLMKKTQALSNVKKYFFSSAQRTRSQDEISKGMEIVLRFLNNRDLKHLLMTFEDL